MVYDRNRHLELIQRNQYFENLGKNFFDEERENYFEFLMYQAEIGEYFYWENRLEIFSMMEQFLKQKISGDQLSTKISYLREDVSAKSNKLLSEFSSGKLRDFNPNLTFKRSGCFISYLYLLCDDFDGDYDNEDFFNGVKECFLRFRDFLDFNQEKYDLNFPSD